MDFTQNYFDLFGLPVVFLLDKQALASLPQKYRDLQKKFHPDKFASQSANEQRLAVQFAAYINNAHDVLKSPVLRAEYLLQLSGYEFDNQSVTISDAQFLMLQIEWRESLAEISAIKDLDAAETQLDALTDKVTQCNRSLQQDFSNDYLQGNFSDAQQQLSKLQFTEKMLLEIDAQEASLS